MSPAEYTPTEILIQELKLELKKAQQDSTDHLAAALAKAQGAMVPPKKDREVTVDSRRTGTSYKFKYATLDSVMDSIRKPLSDNELALVQRLVYGESELLIVTELLHASGQRISSTLPVRAAGAEAQALGSEISYMRRYSICALLGVVADEDDDANMKDGNQARQEKPRPAAAALKKEAAAKAVADRQVAEVHRDAFGDSQEIGLGDRAEVLAQCSVEDMIAILRALRRATKDERAFFEQDTDKGTARYKFVDGPILVEIGRVKNGGPVNTWLDQLRASTLWVPFCKSIIQTADTLGVEVAK